MLIKNWQHLFTVIIALFVFLTLPISDAYSVKFKKYYEGLPNFEKLQPFSKKKLSIHDELRRAIRRISVSDQHCPKKPRKSTPFGVVEICKATDIFLLRSIIKKLAPSLKAGEMTFWLKNLDGERELVIGYTLHDDLNKDPYFSIWLIRWNATFYRAHYAGHFLAGQLHAIRKFGPNPDEKKLFIRFQSCTECCPWIYLIAIDFSPDPEGKAFEFTYSRNHDHWHPTIEYVLPGKGHSVDAEVETRIPTHVSKEGPHLIQHFNNYDEKS